MIAAPRCPVVLVGDCRTILATLPENSVQTCVTSPPYWGLRDYGEDAQIGLEATPAEYIAELVAVFAAVRRVLRDDGTLWVNLGDCYASAATSADAGGSFQAERGAYQNRPPRRGLGGLKPKDLIGMPWRLAFALQADGWWLRSDIIWHKPNPMPSSVADRPTSAHEYVFLLSKSERYFYDAAAIAEPATGRASGNGFDRPARVSIGGRGSHDAWEGGETRNARSVWTITPGGFKGAHFATMPTALAERCIKAGSRMGDTVLDPFAGAGTTGLVASRLHREFVGIELSPVYAAMAERRILDDAPLLAGAPCP